MNIQFKKYKYHIAIALAFVLMFVVSQNYKKVNLPKAEFLSDKEKDAIIIGSSVATGGAGLAITGGVVGAISLYKQAKGTKGFDIGVLVVEDRGQTMLRSINHNDVNNDLRDRLDDDSRNTYIDSLVIQVEDAKDDFPKTHEYYIEAEQWKWNENKKMFKIKSVNFYSRDIKINNKNKIKKDYSIELKGFFKKLKLKYRDT